MDIEDDDDNFAGFSLKKKGKTNKTLSSALQKKVQLITSEAKTNILLNGHLDPKNQSRRSFPELEHHNIGFESFLVKNKNKDQRSQVFDVLRQKLQNMGFNEIKKISDKLNEQVMIIRVIQKVQNTLNDYIIQDEFSRSKMQVKQGTIWLGMICAVEVEWIDNIYRLKRVIDLSTEMQKEKPRLTANLSAYKIMLVKGPFRPTMNNEDKGIGIIVDYLQQLKMKEKVYINCLIVMGPLLSKNHRNVRQFTLETRVEEEYENIVELLKSQASRVLPQLQIFILPSLQDIVSIHPIPQPAYKPQRKQSKVRYLSNPSNMTIRGMMKQFRMDLINYDVLKFIDTYRGGKATKQVRQQNLETYIKQPFLLTNTKESEEPFDEVNLSALYNDGEFGDLVVISSTFSPPYINKVDGRIILNIGSLCVDYNETGNHYLTILSLFDGQGLASERLKIQTVTM